MNASDSMNPGVGLIEDNGDQLLQNKGGKKISLASVLGIDDAGSRPNTIPKSFCCHS